MSSGFRHSTPEHTFLNAAGATGAGTAFKCADYRFIIVTIATDGGADAALTVKAQGAISDTAPTWGSAQSATNMYEFLNLQDAQSKATVAGDTGFVVATADDYRMFRVDVEGLEWVNFIVTARTQGEVTVKGKLFT